MKKKVFLLALILCLSCMAVSHAEDISWRTQRQNLVGIEFSIELPEGFYLLNARTKQQLLKDQEAYTNLVNRQGADYIDRIVDNGGNDIMNDAGQLRIRISENGTGVYPDLLWLHEYKFREAVRTVLEGNGCTGIECAIYTYGDRPFVCGFGQKESLGSMATYGCILTVDSKGRMVEMHSYHVDRETMQAVLSSISLPVSEYPEGWNAPYASITAGKDAAAGITSDMLGKVLHVTGESGGKFTMEAPEDGDYGFRVVAPNIQSDSFQMEVSINGNAQVSLQFNRSESAQLQFIKGIKKGDIIEWKVSDDSAYALMITRHEPSAPAETPSCFTNLAEGDSIESGKDFTLEWNPVEDADEYYIGLHSTDGKMKEFVWGTAVYERNGLTATIPGEKLQAGSHVIEFGSCKGNGTWFYEEYPTQWVNINITPGNGSTSSPEEKDTMDSKKQTEVGNIGFITPLDGSTILAGQKLEVEWTPIPGAKCYSLSANIPATNWSMYDWSETFYNGETSCVIPRSTLIAPSYELELKAWKDENRKRGQELFAQTIEIKVHDKFSAE